MELEEEGLFASIAELGRPKHPDFDGDQLAGPAIGGASLSGTKHHSMVPG
jgi:hypothetical protein